MTLAAQVMTHEGERNTTEVRTATKATNHDIGIFACHLHLFLSLQTDDSLVKTYVIQHGTECVFTIRCGGGQLDSF